jgi:Domain of unknown function (DUF4352)
MSQPTYPQTAQPGAQPPQAPKKKLGWRAWIPLGLVLAVAACGALFEAGNDSAAPPAASDGSTASESEDSQPPATKTYKIGEKATDDDYQFTVTKIRCGVSRIGDSYSNEKAQGQFCLVSMRIKNVGNDAINFSDENQALIDTKGKNYSPDDGAWVYLDDAEIMAEINPGNTFKTTVPFDIPKKAEPHHLLLKAGVWGASDGVKVKL